MLLNTLHPVLPEGGKGVRCKPVPETSDRARVLSNAAVGGFSIHPLREITLRLSEVSGCRRSEAAELPGVDSSPRPRCTQLLQGSSMTTHDGESASLDGIRRAAHLLFIRNCHCRALVRWCAAACRVPDEHVTCHYAWSPHRAARAIGQLYNHLVNHNYE